MRKRHHEGGKDWNRENLVGNSDTREGDDGYPDKIENGNQDSDCFGTEPVEPTDSKFSLLRARQRSCARHQRSPVFLQDLQAAIGPAMTLFLVGLEGVRKQPMTVARGRVVDLPALFEHCEANIALP